MFSSRAYKTALLVSAGSSASFALYACKDNIKGRLYPTWLRAASIEPLDKADFATSLQTWDANWDRRDISTEYKEGTRKPIATRHYILIRHGQYNLSGATDEKRALTKLGKEQAQLTGERLKALGLNATSIHKSTMMRAMETSSIIQASLPGVEVHSSDLLQEGAPIRPVPEHPTWSPSESEFFAEGARIEAAFRKYIHRASPQQEKDSVDVIVCHANVIRYFACRALQFPPEAWLRINLHHCSLTWLTVRPNGKVSLRCLGDTGHMPPEKLSFN